MITQQLVDEARDTRDRLKARLQTEYNAYLESPSLRHGLYLHVRGIFLKADARFYRRLKAWQQPADAGQREGGG